MTIPIPESDPTWCENLVPQYKPDGDTVAIVMNKEEPDTGIKQEGIPINSTLLRGYLNYILAANSEWINYFREGVVGDIYETADITVTATDVMLAKRNTWVDHGTYIKAGVAVKLFTRTA